MIHPLSIEYLPILIFLMIAAGLAGLAVLASYLVSPKQPNSEKLAPYECGFNAFDDARHQFDVRFYLVAILFIIFDLEIAFLFPWAIALSSIGLFGFWSMICFLVISAELRPELCRYLSLSLRKRYPLLCHWVNSPRRSKIKDSWRLD